jgi:hypothetical protein
MGQTAAGESIRSDTTTTAKAFDANATKKLRTFIRSAQDVIVIRFYYER